MSPTNRPAKEMRRFPARLTSPGRPEPRSPSRPWHRRNERTSAAPTAERARGRGTSNCGCSRTSSSRPRRTPSVSSQDVRYLAACGPERQVLAQAARQLRGGHRRRAMAARRASTPRRPTEPCGGPRAARTLGGGDRAPDGIQRAANAAAARRDSPDPWSRCRRRRRAPSIPGLGLTKLGGSASRRTRRDDRPGRSAHGEPLAFSASRPRRCGSRCSHAALSRSPPAAAGSNAEMAR